jgi:transcriptional regulator with XRE-family HTH domain
MDFGIVGKKIRELRRNIGLSQEELAEGICTQAQISKIEKGLVLPFASTLYLISQKLGVDVNYFFDIGMTPRLDYIQEVSEQLKVTRRAFDYEEMKRIVRAELENPLFSQNKSNYQLLLWHKGLYEFELEKDFDSALSTLQDALQMTQKSNKIHTEKEIEILISIGAMHFQKDIHKAFDIYKQIEAELKLVPYQNDTTIKSRFFYNYARILTRFGNYDASVQYCKEAIKWCLKKDNMFLLGELHYQIGYNFELQGDLNKAIQYMEKALVVFDLQKDDKYIPIINNKINELQNIN